MTAATEVIESEVRELVRRRGVDPVRDPDQVRLIVDDVIAEYGDRALSSSLPPVGDEREVARSVLDSVAGFGPLQRWFDDPEVEEIWINEPGRVFIARRGRTELTTTILAPSQVYELVERMLRTSGRRIDLSEPFVDAALPDGSRLHVVIPEITRRHMAVNVRKFVVAAESLAELVELGTVTPQAAQFLETAVAAGLNIIVSGGTQAGKTTLLNGLCAAIPARERVIVCEEVFELRLPNPDLVSMQTRQPNLEGAGEIPLRRLVREALRMRPSRIVVGEVRQAECLDLPTHSKSYSGLLDSAGVELAELVAVRRAALLERISDDRDGRTLGVDRQDEDCRGLAATLHWPVVEPPYIENDTSAFKRHMVTLPDGRRALRVIRPEFRHLLDDLNDGRVDGLIAYDLDRVVRDPRDLEDLIDVVEARGLQGRIKSVTGSLRLDNDADITMARVMVAMANKSSRDTARRVARAARQRAETGGFHGGPPAVGYAHVKDAAGHVIAWQIDPEQAAWLREAAERLLAGETLYGLCTDWNRQGRRTRTGAMWRSQQIKQALISAAVIGKREYAGRLYPEVGSSWEPILERVTWDRLRDLLLDPRRYERVRGAVRKHTLSGLLNCGRDGCGRRLVGQPYNDQATFICSPTSNGGCGKLRIANDALEEFVARMAFARLDAPAASVGLDAERTAVEELALRKTLTDDQAALQRVEDDHYDGVLDRPSYLRQRGRLEERMAETSARLARLTRRHVLSGVTSGAVAGKLWDERDVAWRRTLLSAVIEHIVIKPYPAGIATTLSRRKGEDELTFVRRRREHTQWVLRERVEIIWRA